MKKNKKETLYRLNDSMPYLLSQEEILNSDDEELENEFFHYLDRLNDLEGRADVRCRPISI